MIRDYSIGRAGQRKADKPFLNKPPLVRAMEGLRIASGCRPERIEEKTVGPAIAPPPGCTQGEAVATLKISECLSSARYQTEDLICLNLTSEWDSSPTTKEIAKEMKPENFLNQFGNIFSVVSNEVWATASQRTIQKCWMRQGFSSPQLDKLCDHQTHHNQGMPAVMCATDHNNRTTRKHSLQHQEDKFFNGVTHPSVGSRDDKPTLRTETAELHSLSW